MVCSQYTDMISRKNTVKSDHRLFLLLNKRDKIIKPIKKKKILHKMCL